MARSFLQLSDELKVSFSAAQDDNQLRYLRVEVVGEDTLSMVGTSRKGQLEDDFDNLAMVRVHGRELNQVTGRACAGVTATTQWVLVAWIPDNAKVRDKMIYSSSKLDLRQGLGLGFFEGEYYANTKADLTYESFAASRRTTAKDQLLSEAELLMRDLNKQERASNAGLKSSAMGIIPFGVADDLRKELEDFGAEVPGGGDSGVNWIEMVGRL
ncbi:unnamed protein product [Choristocarpus tenellus]